MLALQLRAERKYLFALGAGAGNALLRPDDAAGGHLRSRYFLDLPGRTCAVIDLDALPETQVQDVLLAGKLLRSRRTDRRQYSATPRTRMQRAFSSEPEPALSLVL